MAGQSAMMTLEKARSAAKGAGCELGMKNGGGMKNCAPTEGKELGKSMGKSASAGDHSGKGGKSKMKHMY
jgi:hypothetical protein